MPKPDWFDRDIYFPANDFEHEAVRIVQRNLRLEESGEIDYHTRSAIRGVQQLFNLKVTGIIDADTAEKIEQIRTRYA